ncbi:MAG: serine hydroxymethyltransferase [Myxococcota bacterium]|nr:serine hydroxymethyltransferase [Myxococcota bacterium]
MNTLKHLMESDPEIYNAVRGEMLRQEEGIELIASENFVSRAVLETAGTVLTNKYAEGPSRRRYYGGCEMVDIAEDLACERARELFGAEYANVQPHSGSQANMAVFLSFLEPGDTILAMDLDAGGHLTHGSPVNFSGRLYNAVAYGVREDNELLDYDEIRSLALEHKPKMLIAGASAYPREIDFKAFSEIAKEVGAYFLVDMAHIAGLVASGEHQSPVPYADFVTTTTHKTLRGARGGLILAKAEYAKKLDSSVCPRIQGGPLMHIIAGKAVAFKEALRPEFKEYQIQIKKNAAALGVAMTEHGFRLVSGGTDNHLILVDLRQKSMTGKVAEKALDKAGITVNKNKVPFDPEKPMVTSGIRIGVPAVTTRGLKEEDMVTVAKFINQALEVHDNDEALAKVKAEVAVFMRQFPLYQDLIETSPAL